MPDPTVLTTDQLRREIGALREVVETRLESLRDISDQRVAAIQLQLDQRYQAIYDKLKDERARVQQQMTDADKAIQAALASAEKAVTKAETAAEKRFESVNEFRKSLADQSATFIPRIEYDAAHEALNQRVTANVERMNALELRLTSRLDLGQGATLGSAASRSDERADKGLGVSQIVAVLVALALLVSVASIVVTLATH